MKDSGLPFFLKFVVLVVILACIAPFFIKGRDGKPLLQLDMLKMPEVSTKVFSDLKKDAARLKNDKMPQMVKKVTGALQSKPSAPEPDGLPTMKLYKWKDKNGVTHYSDRPNPSGPSEVVHVPLGDKKPPPPKTTVKKKVAESPKTPPVQNELSRKVEDIKEYVTRAARLKQDAEAVKKKLEENYKEQQKVLDDLSR